MTSKQEKLAAARKRLKEFQGKSKEIEISKQKVISAVSVSKILRDDFSSNEFAIKRPLSSSEDSKNYQSGILPYELMQHTHREATEENECQRKTPASLVNEENFSKLQLGHDNINYNLMSDDNDKTCEKDKLQNSVCDCANGPRVDFVEFVGENNLEISNSANNISKDNFLSLERHHGDKNRSFHRNDNTNISCIEAKRFFDSDVSNKTPFNDIIRSLQKELESHSQTIAILVQQRNDTQIALSKSQSSLHKKTEEAELLGQQVANLTSSVNDLTRRLFEAEAVVKQLNIEKEENLHQLNEYRSFIENIQIELDKKEEEFQEMRKKYEEKGKNYQQLLIRAQETQAQLSFYQIQLQKNSNEGESGPGIQVSELQNEQANLKKKIEELERKLEVERIEKEESSQKFHIYAQQCKSQMSSLNSQIKSMQLERENLSEENIILSKKLSELENSAQEAPPSKITELQDQVNRLSEENKRLNSDLKNKEEERVELENKIGEKEFELNKLLGTVNELSEENKRLATEAEIPKADERLLATMESDKIAAAKAVSQNQSLKKQVIELEGAFIKLSEEKLNLTNQLAHERHISAELQAMLRNGEGENHEDNHQLQCYHGDEEQEPLVNDSDEIEELRSIVRQLQDDKMELTGRLNAYETNKRSNVKDNKKREEECAENEEQCENTKLLLQQMKEKVRKTMNEIAILDEEKEKLEHLVMQLQGETETIGEYITLYQKQRMLLRQRTQEKDNQLLQLSRDKEELKAKLAALDELVQRLLAERESAGISSGSTLSDHNSSAQIPENTAGKIRALINEIGSTTLINNQSIVFEHCSCCSGRLMTI